MPISCSRLVVPALALLVLLAPLGAPASPSPLNDNSPAVRAFKMTFEAPGGGRGSNRGAWGGGDGSAFDRVRGSVWISNDTREAATDVKMVVHFFDTRFYREAGTCSYPLGTLAVHQTTTVNYRWDDWQGEKIIPWVEIIYRQKSQDKVLRTEYRPYGY